MAISAVFPTGVVVITLPPLYQWDKGHTLRIHVNPQYPCIEVHFSYSGLKEAITCTCTVTGDVATVSVPDSCFEQTETVTAWVFAKDEDSGKTTKTIRIPIIPRAKPPKEVLEV